MKRERLMKILAIVVCVLAVLVILVTMLARSHRKWLEQQSPVGVWRSSAEQRNVTLQFEGGPKEGPYKQVVESADQTIREFGHWAIHVRELRMLIMATDIQNHPRFGQDTVYRISYVGPDSIAIDGPDRPGLVYQRVSDGTKLDFDESAEPSGPADAQ